MSRRILAFVLIFCMAMTIFPTSVLAYYVEGKSTSGSGSIVIKDENGNDQTVQYDDSWEQRFPYGTFAFQNSEAEVTEGETKVIEVYRLGGSKGRVTAQMEYQPVITQLNDSGKSYAYAASGMADLSIEVENPLPIAKYQPIGADEFKAAGIAPKVDKQKSTADTTDEAGDPVYGDTVYYLKDVMGDSYQWQAKLADEDGTVVQDWKTISDATDQTLVVSNDAVNNTESQYSFRCIYKIGEQAFCTNSTRGEVYQPEEDLVEEMPENFVESNEKTFTKLEFEKEFGGYTFPVTFAEGEWVKEIRVTAIDDTVAELDEFGTFTMTACQGGELYSSAATLLLTVKDNEPLGESTVGFEVTEATFDQKEGQAVLKILRAGSLNYPILVQYETTDGTAVAGKQYAEASGSLPMMGGVDEAEIVIPLIAEDERQDALTFTFSLAGVKGGGSEEACKISEKQTMQVHLTSSGKADSGLNIASVLAEASGEDVSGSVGISDDAVVATATDITGTQVQVEPQEGLEAEITMAPQSSGLLRTFTYNAPAISFQRSTDYKNNFWCDYEVVFNYYQRYSETKGYDSSATLGYKDTVVAPTFDANTVNSGNLSDRATYTTMKWRDGVGKYMAHNGDTLTKGSLSIPNGTLLFQEFISETSTTAGFGRADQKMPVWVRPYHTLSYGGSVQAENALTVSFLKNTLDLAKANKDYLSTINTSGGADLKHTIKFPSTSANKTITYEFGMDRYAMGNYVKSNGYTHTALSGGTTTNPYHYTDTNAYGNALSSMSFDDLVLKRRNFNQKGLGLTIYTANDKDVTTNWSQSGVDKTKLAVADQEIYDAIKPTVELASKQGGITTDGKLYVGSTVKVSLKTTPSYTPATGQTADYGVYITDSKGNKKSATVIKSTAQNESNVYYVTLLWDDMKEADLKETYSLNVVMERIQPMQLDITPSVPRKMSGGVETTEIDTTKVQETWEKFWKKTSGITVYSAEVNTSNDSWFSTTTLSLSNSNFTAQTQDNPVRNCKTAWSNAMGVNFGLPEQDFILFNGRQYKGNETIYFLAADLSLATIGFTYYDSAYASSPNVMNTTIDSIGLYYDNNGNGQIDGWYNEYTGYFVLDEGSGDQFVGLIDGDYVLNETDLQPVFKDGKWHQYFLKVFYNMTPRSVTPPVGTNATTTFAQVLPSLTTSITDENTKSTLTTEQQIYSYLLASKGRQYKNQADYDANKKDSDYQNTADNHLMYTAAANKKSMLDLPLGGDHSPVEQSTDADDNVTYSWTPDYVGNLLVAYQNPAPIFIEKSMAGDGIDLSGGFTGQENGVYQYQGNGKDKINGYLGSLTANTTFAIGAQAQDKASTSINGASDLQPESVTRGNIKVLPNADYLALIDMENNEQEKKSSSSGESAYPEFETDVGVTLPEIDASLGDYVTFTSSGYQFGFFVGLPVAKKTSSGAENVKKANQENWNTLTDFLTGGAQKAKEIFRGDDFNKARDKKDTQKGFNAGGVEASITVGLAFTLEYNPIQDEFGLIQFAVMGKASVEFKGSARFTACPVFYLYIKVGADATLQTGMGMQRMEDEEPTNLQNNQSYKKDESFTITTNKKAFNITFKGKFLLQKYKEDGTKDGDARTISSMGGDATQIILYQTGSQNLSENIKVEMTALQDSTVDRLHRINEVRDVYYWNGINLDINAFVEAGAGVGVELLKFEIYVKPSFAISITGGAYDLDTGSYANMAMNSLDLKVVAGFNVTVLFINYSMDMIGYWLHGEDSVNGSRGTWTHGWTALGGLYGGAVGEITRARTTATNSRNLLGISEPTDTEDTQSFNLASKVQTRAFATPFPFQVSGYSSSSGALKLVDGLSTGYSYRAFAANGKNYVLYPISVSADVEAVDKTQLVLSEVVTEGTATGLKNPVKDSISPPYIVVDDHATEADNTGDLDFDYSVDNNNLTVSWTSYKDQLKPVSKPTEPTELCPTGLDEDTYLTFPAVVEPVKPTEDKPESEPEDPLPDNYYTEDDQGVKTPVTGYESIDEAEAAYQEAVALWVIWNDWKTYEEKLPAYEAYIAWYNYFAALIAYDNYQIYLQNLAGNIAKNTVVKTATLNLVDGTAFSTPVVGDDTVGKLRSLTKVTGDTTVYAEATAFTPTEMNAVNDTLKQYIGQAYELYTTDSGSDEANLTTDLDAASAKNPANANGLFRYQYLSALNSMQPNGSMLFAVNADGAPVSYDLKGETLENMDVTTIGGTTYVAYTTNKTAYFDENGTTVTSNFDKHTDLAQIKRFYINTFDGTAWGTAKTMRTLMDFDKYSSSSDSAIGGKVDGVYSGSTLDETLVDPYFSNFNFIGGKLKASDAPETLLVFEMNGNSYVLQESGIQSASGATLTKLFESTEGTEAVIGADDAGNLAVVYTAPVSGTTNNAIYIAWWDTVLNKWGSGNILAMNHLQVHEDSIKYGLSGQELEQAFLGEETGNQAYDTYVEASQNKTLVQGAYDRMSFDNLQVVINTTTDSDTGSTSQQLQVFTQGSLMGLTTKQVDGEPVVVAKPYNDTLTANNGFYAISFGAGKQGVGEASLSLINHNFVAGSSLSGELNFKNTGTAGIRGSETQPITVEIFVNDGRASTTLATLQITEEIKSGDSVSLPFMAVVPLTADLPTGSTLGFTICEDVGVDTAFSQTVDELITVLAKPELLFEDVSLELNGIDGDKVVFDTDLWVANRGNQTAENVFVQFSYGVADQNDELTYYPLDLTGSTLTVEQQAPVTRMASVISDDLKNGIVTLKSLADNKQDLTALYRRQLHGTLKVAKNLFNENDISGLKIRIEIFSDSDTERTIDGSLYVATHGEYDDGNNLYQKNIAHKTFFSAPAQISMALGNTAVIPLSFSSTSGKDANITVEDISNGEEDWKSNINIAYYDQAKQALILAPGQEGRGILNISDLNTNSILAITYQVAPLGEGVNIFKDDQTFTFYNANGTATDVNTAAVNRDWEFLQNISTWGVPAGEAPMNADLSKATRAGAYVEFTTIAEELDLYYTGQVEISCDTLTKPVSATNQKTDVPLKIKLNNPNGERHVVRIKAVTADTQLDKFIPTYGEKVNPIPDADTEAPHIFWSRSFPDTASIKSGAGTQVALHAYILDESGIDSVTQSFTDIPNIVKLSETLWRIDVEVSKNGNFGITAKDTSGNKSAVTIPVNWFNTTVSGGASATAPDLGAGTVYEVQFEDGKPVTVASTKENLLLKLQYALKDNETVQVSRYTVENDIADFTAVLPTEDDGRYDISNNGYYAVRVTDGEGGWTRVIFQLDKVDKNVPAVSLMQSSVDVNQLNYSIKKEGTGAIDTIKLNGFKITGTNLDAKSINSSVNISFNGEYVLEVTDTAGNMAQSKVTASGIKTAATTQAIQVVDSTAATMDNGKITIHSSKITGGSYDDERSNTATNSYAGKYEFSVVDASSAFVPADLSSLLDQELIDAQAAETARKKDYMDALTWIPDTDTAADLTVGDKVVYLHNVIEGNDDVVAVSVTVQDRAVKGVLDVLAVSKTGDMDGSIIVTPAGGSTGAKRYEFALLPMVAEADALTAIADIEDAQWLPQDDDDLDFGIHTFDNLAEGWYQVAIREKGNPNANNAWTTQVQVGSQYATRTLQDGNVTVTGPLVHRNAVLTVTENSLHDTSCDVCKRLAHMQNLGRVLHLTDIALTLSGTDNANNNPTHLDEVTVSILVGDEYNGKTITMVQCLGDGSYQTAEAMVTNGVVQMTTKTVSLVAVFNKEYDMEDLPEGETVTKMQAIEALWKLAGSPKATATMQGLPTIYQDNTALQWAVNAGLLTSDFTGLDMDDDLTRGEYAMYLYRYAKYKGYSVTLPQVPGNYKDLSNVSDSQARVMSWAITLGFMDSIDNQLQSERWMLQESYEIGFATFVAWCEKNETKESQGMGNATGDSSAMGIFIVLLLVAIGGILALIIYKKRK